MQFTRQKLFTLVVLLFVGGSTSQSGATGLGPWTWELGALGRWAPSEVRSTPLQGKEYLLRAFADEKRRWGLELVEYACSKCATYDELAGMLAHDAKVTGRGRAAELPALYYEIFEEDSGLKFVAAVTGDKSRALRITIRWRVKEQDETAEAVAELKSLLAGLHRINL